MISFNNGRDLHSTTIQQGDEEKVIELINKMLSGANVGEEGILLLQRFVDEYEKLARCRALTEGAMLTGSLVPDSNPGQSGTNLG